MSIDAIMVMVVVGLFVVAIVMAIRQAARKRAGVGPRQSKPPRDPRADAYFRAMFPELQPYFHPEKVVRLVRDRNGRADVVDGRTWKAPEGFETVAAVAVALVAGRERLRLQDAARATLVEFDYERAPTGAALRIGRGKLTAALDQQTNPRVRYWHPEREFKWSRKGGWQFTTPLADESIDSDERGSRFSSASSSSSSSSSGYGGVAAAAGATAGAAALVSGAGGAFAGGGASGDWDAAAGARADSGSGAPAY